MIARQLFNRLRHPQRRQQGEPEQGQIGTARPLTLFTARPTPERLSFSRISGV